MRPVEIESLALKHPLCYGISYIVLPKNRLWSVADRPWIDEMYRVVNPYYIERHPVGLARCMAVIKSTQCGMSTMGIARLFHFADFWPSATFYMLPRQMDVWDFVGTRIDPMIQSSPRLSSLLSTPDSTQAKRLGNSFVYFHEASVEPRMIDADVLMADEVDLCDQDNVATARNRLDASNWHLEYYYSTPTVSNYGIHAIYLNSDMRRWIIRCPACNRDQYLDWDANLRIIGPANNPKKVFYGCAGCNQEITQELIYSGRWIAEKPDLSRDVIGFHITQMMHFTAEKMYAFYRDPKMKLIEFYRKRLGMPYELGEGSLERDDFIINCFDEVYEMEDMADGTSKYYMGLDQGNEIQIVIAKAEPETNRKKVVHIELIPFDEGFDRVVKLMRLFKVRLMVGDANPNRHSMANVRNDFPGKVLLADYVEQRPRYKIVKGKIGKRQMRIGVTLHRTQCLDHLFEEVRKGEWQLPGHPNDLHNLTELLIDHATALRRDIEIRRTPSGEVSVGVYRAIRADHLAHALGFAQLAIELDQKRGYRVEEIPLNPTDEDEEEELIYGLEKSIVDGIIYYLAEVPREQIDGYLTYSTTDPTYIVPFPLSHKIQRATEHYSLETVIKVMEIIVQERK